MNEAVASISKTRKVLKSTFDHLLDKEMQRAKVQDIMCECYCKFPDEYMAMYHDPTEAQENMDREKCNYCPLMNL